eukprot:UC1_evm3s202
MLCGKKEAKMFFPSSCKSVVVLVLALVVASSARPHLQHRDGIQQRHFTAEDHPLETKFHPGDAAISPVTKAWTKGQFEVHVFQVGQGHSQLIVFPSGYSILVDVFEPSWNTCNGARGVAAKIERILGHTHVNVGTGSHWHLDHIGYATKGGFWCLIEEGLLTFDKFVDRDGGVWKGDGALGGPLNGECDLEEIEWHNAGTVGGTAEKWVCYATDPANKRIFPIRELARHGAHDQIVPPDEGARVTIVQVDAKGVKQEDGKTPVDGDHTQDPLPPSENDYSIALRVEYKGLLFATAGDSDGEYNTSTRFGYTYNDIETPLGTAMGQVDFMLVNHHGSSHSSNQAYIDSLKPQAAAISCGYNNSHGHPAQPVLDRLLAATDLYMTQKGSLERDYGRAFIIDGDVVLESTDGKEFTINGKKYISHHAKAQAHVLAAAKAEKEAGAIKKERREEERIMG